MADLNVVTGNVELCSENDVCFNATITVRNDDVNETSSEPEITSKDATWILTSAIIIFTMQTGKVGKAPYLAQPFL